MESSFDRRALTLDARRPLRQHGRRGKMKKGAVVLTMSPPLPSRNILLRKADRLDHLPASSPGAGLAVAARRLLVLQPAMIEVGQTVGNYAVTTLLGEGGMGMVFLAEHPVIGRKVALKVIHPRYSHNVEMVTRFVNEAKTISQIGHEHVVEVTDFGRTSAEDFYFVMEHLEGEALSEAIGRGAPFPLARAVVIAAQIADALGAVHERGVVHCDLKPENVFLVERRGTLDFVKVLDFGLAKLTRGDHAEPRNAHGNPIMGTPSHMSPEQCDGSSAIDARADIYALGVILFEMLTGKLPFAGDTSREILVKQLTMEAPSARAIVPDLPAEMDRILQRALAKAPAERFPSMAAFRAALFDLRRQVEAESRALVSQDESDHALGVRPLRGATIARRRSFPVIGAMAIGVMALIAAPAYGNGFWQRMREAATRLPARIGIIAAADRPGSSLAAPDEPAREAPAELVVRQGDLPETLSSGRNDNDSSPLLALVRESSPSRAATGPNGAPRSFRAAQGPHVTRRLARNMAPREVETTSADARDPGPRYVVTNDVDTREVGPKYDNTDDDILPPSDR